METKHPWSAFSLGYLLSSVFKQFNIVHKYLVRCNTLNDNTSLQC